MTRHARRSLTTVSLLKMCGRFTPRGGRQNFVAVRSFNAA